MGIQILIYVIFFESRDKALIAYPNAVLRTRESISSYYHEEVLPAFILEAVEVKYYDKNTSNIKKEILKEKEISVKELSIKIRDLEKEINDKVKSLEYETGIKVCFNIKVDKISLFSTIDGMTYYSYSFEYK